MEEYKGKVIGKATLFAETKRGQERANPMGSI